MMKGLSRAIINIKKQAERDVRRYSLECSNRIIRRTPFDEGTLKGGWQPSIDTPISSVLKRQDKSGAAVMADIRRESKQLKLGGIFNMTNNLPYAARIEFNGWSAQAAEGMMRISVIEVAAEINAGRAL